MKRDKIIGKSIVNFEAYVDFREKNREIATRDAVENFQTYGKIVSLFYKKVGEYMIESSEGVWIDKLGYFGVMNTNKKRLPDVNVLFNEEEFNWETGGYSFCLLYQPYQVTSMAFRTFTFDYSYTYGIRSKFSKKLKTGFRYNYNGQMFIKSKDDKKRIKSRDINTD